ncbi:MAG: ATP-grasp domain-containing protein [Chloroflexi bacterium]|nr:ATP-grasp domain-containing protein [Chloroflexota bacterium]
MRPRIAIIYNEPNPDLYGTIVEKKASLAILTGMEAIHQALTDSGYPVIRIPLIPPLESARERLKNIEADLVFSLFEGFDGQPEAEAAIVNSLSKLGLTYTGCPGTALSLALDKVRTKTRLDAIDVDTPDYQLLSPETVSMFHMSYPCIVKPYAEDGSNGITEESVVYDFTSLQNQVRTISERFRGRALVEEFVDGREFNITVLGDKKPTPLPISEIVYSLPPEMPKILTFSAKWEPQSVYFENTKAVCPAEISAELQERIIKTAVSAFRLLGRHGYARVDFRLDSEGKLKIIDLNPNPDISPDSGAALQASAKGMNYNQFIEKIVLLALEKE